MHGEPGEAGLASAPLAGPRDSCWAVPWALPGVPERHPGLGLKPVHEHPQRADAAGRGLWAARAGGTLPRPGSQRRGVRSPAWPPAVGARSRGAPPTPRSPPGPSPGLQRALRLLRSIQSLSLFFKEVKGWGLGAAAALRCGFLENIPQEKILLSQNVNADQMSLPFFFFFCMCPLTAGKNISSNYSPQTHTFCLSPDKGI